jgi:hypothetical protein
MLYNLTEFINVETISGNKRPKATVTSYMHPQVEFMQKWYSEMIAFAPHHYHVE